MKFFIGFILTVAAVLFFCNQVIVRSHLPANTYLAWKNLGYKSPNWLLLWLAKNKNQKLKIQVQARVYNFDYQTLGIILDLNQTYNDLVKETKLVFPHNWLIFYRAFWSSRTVMPTLIFTQDYYEKISNLQFDFSTQEDQILVDSKKKNLMYQNYQDIFVFDAKSLEKEIVSNFGKAVILKPKIHRVFDNQNRIKIDAYNKQLSQVMGRAVNLYYENGNQVIAQLSEPDLRNLLQIDYDQSNEQLSIGVDEQILEQKTQQLSQKLNLGYDLQFDQNHLKQNLVSLINTRFNGYDSDYIYVRLIEKPNTNGGEAEQYIEIDLSQQKMYLWEGGKNLAIHRISSGLYYPTPPGRYRILNKANNAYSYIYNVWMPFWMAFSLDPKVHAYLGIHELPYWVDGAGQEIRRPRDFIGSPHTGGCVSLDVGEAQLVYDWAKIGTPVLIFD